MGKKTALQELARKYNEFALDTKKGRDSCDPKSDLYQIWENELAIFRRVVSYCDEFSQKEQLQIEEAFEAARITLQPFGKASTRLYKYSDSSQYFKETYTNGQTTADQG